MKILNVFILTLLVISSVGAMWSSEGTTVALATNAITSPSYPLTIGIYGRCYQTTYGTLIGISDITSNAVYYSIVCNALGSGTGGYYTLLRNTSEIFTKATGTEAVAGDETPDTLVLVMESATSKKLYINGTLSLTVTNSVNMAAGANDLSISGLRRLAGSLGNTSSIINHAWLCQDLFTAEDVAEYDNNKHDKDYIRQLCARKKGAQFIFYPMTDMLILANYQLGLHPAYKHENGYPIKDLGGGMKNANLITSVVQVTGTYDIQN